MKKCTNKGVYCNNTWLGLDDFCDCLGNLPDVCSDLKETNTTYFDDLRKDGNLEKGFCQYCKQEKEETTTESSFTNIIKQLGIEINFISVNNQEDTFEEGFLTLCECCYKKQEEIIANLVSFVARCEPDVKLENNNKKEGD